MLDMLEFACGQFWESLNRERFGGSLRTKPEFRVSLIRDALGYFHGDFPSEGKCLVEISTRALGLGDDARELHATILHEMCHQMQWERRLPMGHNTSFDAFMSTAMAGGEL